jgi:hypothetical protein
MVQGSPQWDEVATVLACRNPIHGGNISPTKPVIWWMRDWMKEKADSPLSTPRAQVNCREVRRSRHRMASLAPVIAMAAQTHASPEKETT